MPVLSRLARSGLGAKLQSYHKRGITLSAWMHRLFDMKRSRNDTSRLSLIIFVLFIPIRVPEALG